MNKGNSTENDYIASLPSFVQERVFEAQERDENRGESIIRLHGFEKAMIGTTKNHLGKVVSVYEEGLCLKILRDRIRTDFPEKTEEEIREDAYDAWDYDTMRAFPYMGDCAPVIIQSFDVDESRWLSLLDNPVCDTNN